MKSSIIRQKFLDFFVARRHACLPGIPLVPPEDPTLLFTSAGMVPFKDLWSGTAPPPHSKIVSVQKCLRAGGKDSDLENVGKDSRHHTFFEMLGNFSFGDYFKEEAIAMAWEFIRAELDIPREKIFASFFEKDHETLALWKKFLPEEKIIPLGEKDNFWGPAGETGVCGPCSEIYYDRGPETGCARADCRPGCDCERFLEFWNLVFPQFNKSADGSMKPLARPGIDTGMGLERIAAICQGKNSNFETDLFAPLTRRLREKAGETRTPDGDQAFRVAADHARAVSFLAAENILPGNEGRAYVARRILRRATNFLRAAGVSRPVIFELVPVIAEVMGDFYPAVVQKADFIRETIRDEEKKYLELLGESRRIFARFAESFHSGTVPGDVVFQLYDTHGIPLEVVAELAAEDNLALDEKGYREEMKRRRENASRKGGDEKSHAGSLVGLPTTRFVGHDNCRSESELLVILPDRQKKGRFSLVLDETPFYPERGGQVGDGGVISGKDFEFTVAETMVDDSGYIHHSGTFKSGKASGGEKVLAAVDEERRRLTAANHTATHLLHAALREILGDDTSQAGSLVAPGYFRFDFICEKELPEDLVKRVEKKVNRSIRLDIGVERKEQELEKALEDGALALFTEKYARKVRVITVPGHSREVCGGLHARATGEIGLFLVTGLSSIGRGTRRIEGLTGEAALDWARERIDHLENLSGKLKVKPLEVPAEIERRENETREQKARMEVFLEAYLERKTDTALEKSEMCGKLRFVSIEESRLAPDESRRLMDRLKKAGKEKTVFLIVSGQEQRIQAFLGLTDDLAREGFNAREILRETFSNFGGGAGGRADLAQAGAKKSVQPGQLATIVREMIVKAQGQK